ncbi:unnamed protein product [Rotaria sp. Silwood2]|nr:unnamed protein product [Rotaria sp. Silwood2]CAF4615895.1 unnamed protein product [Rotaria sp. Silwood2]
MTSTKIEDTTNVINISDAQLTNDQLKVLAKGLKFIITPKALNIVDIITNIEHALHSVTPIIKQAAIAEINTFVKQWKKTNKINLNYNENKAKKQLKNMKNIIIVYADKGGKIIVMNKADYISKIEEKLDEKDIYEQVNDPTNLIKKKLTTLTNRLFKANRITKNLKNELTSNDDIPRIRGQPKVHEENCPMRLITSTKNTILSPVSKYAFSYIKQLRETIENTTCNTSKFINEIFKVKIEY